MTRLVAPPEWHGPSRNPNDRQFGDVVETARLDAAAGYDAVLVGEPYDDSGARDAPRAIREALSSLSARLDDGPVGPVADLGTVDAPGDGWPGRRESIRECATRLHGAETVPVFLGGGPALTLPNAAPLLETGRVGVLGFRGRLGRPRDDGGPAEAVLDRLFEAGLDSFAAVGARPFESSASAADVGGGDRTRVPPRAVGADPDGAVEDALSSLGAVDAVHVSVSPDVLDPAAAPGVSDPLPGGIRARELFGMLERVAADERVAGLEVIGCVPSRDPDDRTTRTAARAVAHFLAGLGGRP